MLNATIYGQHIAAPSMATLKRKASKIANGYNNAVDEMNVTDGEHSATFYRINRKAPNNTNRRGEWK